MSRTTIFVSYSHHDAEWLKRVRVHLAPLERELGIELWSDKRIQPGTLWNKELTDALGRSCIAILLVSAGFFASDFIVNEELPPLLTAAQANGATILPLIVSKSRFSRTPSLAQFQAVNEPDRPLIDLSRGEQERVLDHLSSVVESLVQQVPAAVSPRDAHTANNEQRAIRREVFSEESGWKRINKIGEWSRGVDGSIQGEGLYHYLLSSHIYGDVPFGITTRLTFQNFERFAHKRWDTANPGLVLGWGRGANGRRYLNVLLTGLKVVLEEVGGAGGDDYRDFRHLDRGAPLELVDGRVYEITVTVGVSAIDVHVNGNFVYSVEKPRNVTGLVGLRPWRSRLFVSHFEVFEL